MYMKEARDNLNAVYFGKLRLFQLMFRVAYANILGFFPSPLYLLKNELLHLMSLILINKL